MVIASYEYGLKRKSDCNAVQLGDKLTLGLD